MQIIRILTAGAVFALAVNGAVAQTATTTPPGKPMSLLQILQRPAKPKPRPHVKTARKAAAKIARRKTRMRRVVARRDAAPAALASPAPPPAPVQTAIATPPANIWPGLNAPAAADPDLAAPAPDAASAPADSALKELVVGGQTVQVASPDTVNDIDRAADKPDPAENAALKTDFTQASSAPAVKQAMVIASAQHAAGSVGSASWIAKVLAALGGAIAAGSTAWFMIGSTPRLTYREATASQDEQVASSE